VTCEVKVVKDSLHPATNRRITTLQLRYWRGIHGEFMTHRVFSRNASSSRAIPIITFLKQVWKNPAGPTHWGANNPGMQAKTELTGFKLWFAKQAWKWTGRAVCAAVWLTNKVAKPHKQTFNRLLEPWQYISVIVTATEWDNFFELRNHKDAQPEIRELAIAMLSAMENSTPVHRTHHLPYITDAEEVRYVNGELELDTLFKLSTARCARVSYLTHDGIAPSTEKDIRLHDQLVGSVPIHASPTEHQAVAADNDLFYKNFRGWKQYRIDVEDRLSYNL
jgi:hypothetical protein